MRWEDERYVRVFTRDTVGWLGLSFEAQALWSLLLRKFDRAGLIDLGKHGKRGLALAIGHPGKWQQLEPAVEELLADGCLVIEGERAVAPNFIEAQESVASNKERQRKFRDSARGNALKSGGGRRPSVTRRNATVTDRNAASRGVTPSRAVPSRAVPNQDQNLVGLDRVLTLFGYWKQELNHPRAQLDAKLRAVLERAFETFDLPSLMAAVDGCKISPHHQGQNEHHTVYDSLELICRDAKHINTFIAFAEKGLAKPVVDVRRGNVRAEDQDWSKEIQGLVTFPAKVAQ